ncbi:MAG TPA: hypothetical protein VGI70_00590, partial [Polyangiales bacterium]
YFGDANLLLSDLDHYTSVSADDVKRVAGQYFAPTNRTILDVVPAKASPAGKPASPPSAASTKPTPPPSAANKPAPAAPKATASAPKATAATPAAPKAAAPKEKTP